MVGRFIGLALVVLLFELTLLRPSNAAGIPSLLEAGFKGAYRLIKPAAKHIDYDVLVERLTVEEVTDTMKIATAFRKAYTPRQSFAVILGSPVYDLQRVVEAADSVSVDAFVSSRMPNFDPRFMTDLTIVPKVEDVTEKWKAELKRGKLESPEDVYWQIVEEKNPKEIREFKRCKPLWCLPDTEDQYREIFGKPPTESKMKSLEKVRSGSRYRTYNPPMSREELFSRIAETSGDSYLLVIGHNSGGQKNPRIALPNGDSIPFEEVENEAIRGGKTVIIVSCFSSHVDRSREVRFSYIPSLVESAVQMGNRRMHPQEFIRLVSSNLNAHLAQLVHQGEQRITFAVVASGAGVTAGGIRYAIDLNERPMAVVTKIPVGTHTVPDKAQDESEEEQTEGAENTTIRAGI